MPFQANVLQEGFPEWMSQQHKDIGAKAEKYAGEDYIPYPAQMKRYAEMAPDTLRAHQLAREGVGAYAPYLQGAQNYFSQGAQDLPENIERYMNPYTQNVIDTMQEKAGRAYREQFLPQLENAFVGAGQHGSTRHQEMASRTARDMQEALNQQVQEALMHGYDMSGKLFNADQARKLEAGTGMGNLSGLDTAGRLTDIATLGDQGQYQQAHEQGRLNMNAQDFLAQKAHPWNQLQQQAAIMHGIPAPKSTYQAIHTPEQPQWNNTGNLLNAAGSLGGALRTFGRKAGGSIKKTMSIPKLKGLSAIKFDLKKGKKNAGLAAKKKRGLGNKPFTQSSMIRQPKVGAKSKIKMKGVL